jgi:hypothetical protein
VACAISWSLRDAMHARNRLAPCRGAPIVLNPNLEPHSWVMSSGITHAPGLSTSPRVYRSTLVALLEGLAGIFPTVVSTVD